MKKIKKIYTESKHFILIILFTLVLLFIGAPLFNAIATNKLSFHFINKDNYDAWIGFYGSVLGGALTLGGVWWTIKYEKQELEKSKNKHDLERKEELFLQYKPLLKCDIHYSTSEDINKLFYFQIENVGRGELLNINISFPDELLESEMTIGPEILLPSRKLSYLILCTSKIKAGSNAKIIIEGNDCFKNKITTIFTFNINIMDSGTINLNLKNIEYDNNLKH